MGQAANITVDPGAQAYYKAGLVSYMGRVMYNYDDRYMASVAFRSDGSSRLAEGHRWHTYPAVSLGWNISREKFMQSVKWIDNLKLRVGYGETSNQSVNPYQTLGTLSTVLITSEQPMLQAITFRLSRTPNSDGNIPRLGTSVLTSASGTDASQEQPNTTSRIPTTC